MTSDTNLFVSMKPDRGIISLADKSTIPYTAIGTVHLKCLVNNNIEELILEDVLLVPGLGKSLFSWRAAKRGGKCILIDENILEIKLKSDKSTILQAYDVDNQFIIKLYQPEYAA